MMKQIAQLVWRYHDICGCTSYLVVGENKAVMIDCGMMPGPILSMIREITQLPVELLLTHAHPGHYGAAAEFERICLHEKDIAALEKDVVEQQLALLKMRNTCKVFAFDAAFAIAQPQAHILEMSWSKDGAKATLRDEFYSCADRSG